MASTKAIPESISCKELKDLIDTRSHSIVILEADVGKQVQADFQA
jgi:hypothetical protein